MLGEPSGAARGAPAPRHDRIVRERIEPSGRAGPDLPDARVAHRDHYLSLVETAATRLRGPDEHRWLDQIEAEFDNIRAALTFSIADPDSAEPGLRLATELKCFCYIPPHTAQTSNPLTVPL